MPVIALNGIFNVIPNVVPVGRHDDCLLMTAIFCPGGGR